MSCLLEDLPVSRFDSVVLQNMASGCDSDYGPAESDIPHGHDLCTVRDHPCGATWIASALDIAQSVHRHDIYLIVSSVPCRLPALVEVSLSDLKIWIISTVSLWRLHIQTVVYPSWRSGSHLMASHNGLLRMVGRHTFWMNAQKCYWRKVLPDLL